jgi:CRISPR system Cascade subunit CasA
MATFDLLAEPWIPVVDLHGDASELSIRAVLARAHELREILDPIPTVEFGLYRLLVALVLDIFQPEDTLALGELLDDGHFDADRMAAYFERWKDRFALFHPRHPFLQTAGMDREDAKPLAALMPLIPSGTNAVHFHHAQETEFGVSPAGAARLLTAIAPFMTAGGAGLSPSINGAPPWYALVIGETLFHTLCLNSLVLHLPLASGDAPPAWRQDESVKATRYASASLLQSLTWQPRRIQLIPGVAGRCSITEQNSPTLIRTMRFIAGAACDFIWRDPNVAYKITDKQVPLRPQEEKAIWRDTGPLSLLREEDYISENSVKFERPAVVTQIQKLIENGALPRGARYRLMLYGMRTDMKMKVFEWQRDSLPLHTALLGIDGVGGRAQTAIERADKVAYQLKLAIKHAYPRDGKGNGNAFDTLITRAQRRYWDELREHFDALLQTLAHLPADDTYDAALTTCLSAWEKAVSTVGNRALEDAIGDLDADADAMQRQVVARRHFRFQVWRLFHPEALTEKKRRGRAATV